MVDESSLRPRANGPLAAGPARDAEAFAPARSVTNSDLNLVGKMVGEQEREAVARPLPNPGPLAKQVPFWFTPVPSKLSIGGAKRRRGPNDARAAAARPCVCTDPLHLTDPRRSSAGRARGVRESKSFGAACGPEMQQRLTESASLAGHGARTSPAPTAAYRTEHISTHPRILTRMRGNQPSLLEQPER
jgi:hypothetical protein